ncbi:hypothetical protein PG985_015737 [Apiospora marii]|uniref:Uncharacterized protein n=1 Tax=Apiospora marii TaxID=335849 RepID=A0ABR1S4I7_9PEZI
MASSSSSIRKQQSLARVAALGPYAGVDHHQSAAAELDPAVRATTPLTALERELRSKASDDSIGAVVATRPDAEYLTRKRERRRSMVSNTTTTSRGRSHQPGGPRPRRTSMESERSRNRAKLVSSSVSSYTYSSDSPSPSQEESAGRAYLYEQLERQRAKLALGGGGGGDSNSVAIDDSDDHDDRRARHRRSSAVLRPSHGNAQASSFKAKSEAGYYLGNSSTREKRRQSRAYPPMVRTGFDEVPHWAADAMKAVVLDNKQSSSSSSSSRSSRYHHDKSSSSRRSSTTTITVPSPYPGQEPTTPSTTTSTKPRSRKRRGAVSARSVSGATTDDQEDDARSTHSGYSRYSTATYPHYPRGGGDYNNNPYHSAAKRTSWRPSSGVDSSRARDLAAAAEQQRKLEQEQETVRELERELERVEREREAEREREREREHRRRQKQKQKEVLRVDSVEFEMYSPPSPAGTTTVATPATATATAASTPKSATPRSPIYDVPGTKSRRSTGSSRPATAIYLPPSQEPAASFDVVGVYRTETVAKHELEPVDVLNKSNFLDGEVYDNSYENTAVASPDSHSNHHRRSRRYSRDPAAAEPRPASRSSCRSLSPSRMLEKGVEFKDRVHEALHDFKEDQKARAGIIPPDPNREYPSWYNTHPRGEKREHREHHHHRREEVEGRPPQQQRRRVRRNSLQQQQQQQPPPPPQFATVLTSSPDPASSPTPPQSASASFAGRMASANTTSSSPQHRATPYRAEMANEAMPQQLNDMAHAPPATSRQDQERQELFCRATRRGGRPESFLRRPGGGAEVRQQAVTENPSMALRMRAQEKINNEKRLSGLDFGFGGSNNNEGSSNISRLDSLHMPRSSNNAAATANAAVPESHRRSFFAPQWMQQQQQKQEKEQQRLPVEVVDDNNEPSLPKPAESVVSDFSFVAGQSEKLDVPPQRPLYAPSSKRDDRHGLPSQSPSPPAIGVGGGGARRLRRTNGVSISQLR